MMLDVLSSNENCQQSQQPPAHTVPQQVPLHPPLPLTRRTATRIHRRPFPSHLQRGVPVTRPAPSRSREPLPLGRKSPVPPSIDQPGSIPKATHRPSAELSELQARFVSKVVPATKPLGHTAANPRPAEQPSIQRMQQLVAGAAARAYVKW